MMLDDFFVRAMLAGLGMVAVTGPLGCFVVWRRLSYFGDTLAHASLLGVALALLLHVNVTLAVFVLALLVALAMLGLQTRVALSADALLGLLSHGALAIGLLALAFMTWVRFDLNGLLFGDLLAVSKTDVAVVYGGGLAVLAVLIWCWKPLFAVTISRDMAAAEGIAPARYDVLLMVLLAAVVAVSIKIVGVLLITAMLIIPAGAARRLAVGPVSMAFMSVVIGALAVIGGLFASLKWDSPSGPAIVVAAVALFMVGLALPLNLIAKRSLT